jgi:hypothetical protein
MKRATQRSAEAGYALVLVLWIVAALGDSDGFRPRASSGQLAHATSGCSSVLAESAIWLAVARVL